MRAAARAANFVLLAQAAILFAAAEVRAEGAADDRADKATQLPPVVAAYVNNVPIYVAEVDEALLRLVGDRKMSVHRRNLFTAQMLEQIVDQRTVLEHLRRTKQAASDHAVDAEVKQLTAQLAARKTTLAEHLASRRITEQALREDLHWRLSWRKFLDKTITDEALEKYFLDFRGHYDGRRLRVSQILLLATQDDDSRIALEKKLVVIREQIESGELSFADATKKYSQAPSARDGGDLGFLTRHGEMHPSVAQIAFNLKVGEMSGVVYSPHGLHLLKCTDIEPGTRTWQDARKELRQALTRTEFQWRFRAEYEKVKVRYTGAATYRDMKTGKLVVPVSGEEKKRVEKD